MLGVQGINSFFGVGSDVNKLMIDKKSNNVCSRTDARTSLKKLFFDISA